MVTWQHQPWLIVDAADDAGGQQAILACLRDEVPGFRRYVGVADSLTSKRFPGEQTNTSVFFSHDDQPELIIKIFRRVEAGVNPDIEIHQALAGSDTVAQLRGVWSWQDFHLGIAVAALAGARDGFVMAREAAVNSRSFSQQAAALGARLAEAHRLLACRLETGYDSGSELSARLLQRFEMAARQVPQLVQFLPQAAAIFDALPAGRLPIQRIHGDCHLGQALFTNRGWCLVDFEGEPLKPLAERRQLDSPWRDVAGMLRSFHYATYLGKAPRQWLDESRQAFLSGYGLTDETALQVVQAFEVDKAGYEAWYESQNRPAFVSVPVDYLSGINS